MRTCPACGGTSPAHARWCGQCFAALAVAGTPAIAGSSALTAPAVGASVAPRTRHRAPTEAEIAGRLLHGRALFVVIAAIGIGAVGAAASWLLGHDESLEPETYIRYAIVITLGVYAVVGALVVRQLAPGVRLRWTRGNPATGVLVGAAVGGTVGGVLLALVSASAGRLAPDPRAVTLMSEGDVPHLVVTVLLVCCCAPLVEEVLFRGLLLESLRSRSRTIALLASGAAFAVWHLNPGALRYYALMGILFGVVYLRRGLVGSIAAHATFNGVLAAAALAVVLAPPTVATAGDLSINVPGGWRASPADTAGLQLTGPSGAALLVLEMPSSRPPSLDTIVERITTGDFAADASGLTVDASTTRRLALPGGDAVAVDIDEEGHRGTVAFLSPPRGAVTAVYFLSAGSAKARADFPGMLASLRIG